MKYNHYLLTQFAGFPNLTYILFSGASLRNLFLIFFLAVLNRHSVAQTDLLEPNPIMPLSPNASSLAIFADYPVSHYTGVPNISVPLYEINVDGFKFPITLAYHASGIKVSQEASWVGLGWSLNLGGSVSRTIKGYDDFLEFPPVDIQEGY